MTPDQIERAVAAMAKVMQAHGKTATLMSLTPQVARQMARAAIAAAWEWKPIAEADTSREIIALAIDGSVYRMDTHQNHRGEICWQTWANVGFVDGYITHFVYLPTPRSDERDGDAR